MQQHSTAQHSTAQPKLSKLLGFCLLILFFFSTNESKGQACEPCGSGPWTSVMIRQLNKPCTISPFKQCKIAISVSYRITTCNNTTKLQFKINKVYYKNQCFEQNPCYDIDLFSEALFWVADWFYEQALLTPGQYGYDPLLSSLIIPETGCLVNMESYSTGCTELIQRSLNAPVFDDGEEYYWEERQCIGESCCMQKYVMCPRVNTENQERDLFNLCNTYYFNNNCLNTLNPFGELEVSNIIYRSGCIPTCNRYNAFPIINCDQ